MRAVHDLRVVGAGLGPITGKRVFRISRDSINIGVIGFIGFD